MNFRDLDDLIHGGAKEIILDSDIVLSDGEKSQYPEGIRLDVDDLTIDGKGHAIDARRLTRIFCCTGKNVTVKGVVLKNGYAEDGGAIFNRKGELSITECTLTENTAQWRGGAIYNDDGELTITGSTLNNNTSQESGWVKYGGGAIYSNYGCLNIIKSSFGKNRAREHGCAIYNDEGKVTLKHAEFAGNFKISYGFGSDLEEDIYNWGYMIILGKYSSDKIKSIYNEDCVCVSLDYVDKTYNPWEGELNLQLENCKGSDYLNGLIHSGEGEIVLDSDIVMDDLGGIELGTDNLVIDGAGHCIDAKEGRIFRNDRKGIVLKNITLINAQHGAIVNSGEMTLHDCRLINNRNFQANFRDCRLSQTYDYVYGGGAVFNTGRMNFIRCVLSDNMVCSDAAFTVGAGAAIFNLNGEITLTDCRLSDNIATTDNDEGEIEECTVYGGAISSLNGKIDIADCEFTRNCAYVGGGIYGFSTEISIANTRFAGNGFRHTFGGAMYVERSKTRIADSEFDSNRAYSGGAIWVDNGEMEIRDGIFKSNRADGHKGSGGAIDALQCKLTIDGGEFLDNAADYGGAIMLSHCDDDIYAKFYGNEAPRGFVIEYLWG